MKKTLAIIILILTPILVCSAYNNLGTSAYTFLNIDASVKAGGMGGAYVAIPGLEGLAYNIAAVGELENSSLSFSYMNWALEGSSLNNLIFAIPLAENYVLGIQWKALNFPSIKKYDEDGFFLRQEFVPNDNMATISLTTGFGENIDFGIGIGAVKEKIDSYAATAYFANFGLIYELDALKAGISANYIPIVEKELIEDEMPLPTTIRLGVSYAVSEALLVAMDIEKPNHNTVMIHAGVQYTWADMVDFRIGYKTGSFEGFTLGLGAHKELIENFVMGIDYAFGTSSDDFNLLHRFGVSMDF